MEGLVARVYGVAKALARQVIWPGILVECGVQISGFRVQGLGFRV